MVTFKMGLVYKYGSKDCIKYLLEDQTLRFAPSSAQNDINEFLPNLAPHLENLIQQTALDLQVETFPFDREHENAFRIGVIRGWLDTVNVKYSTAGILSLTTKRGDLLMWAHYAEKGTGLCVGFDETAAIFVESSFSGTQLIGINPVRYSSDRPTIDGRPEAERFVEMALTKSKDWEYEQEVRCIRNFADRDDRRIRFDPSDVKEIILGSSISKESVLKCIELHAQHFSHAELLWAQPDLGQYKMLFCPVPKPDLLDICAYRESLGDFDGLQPFGKA